jgi:ribosomal protein S12 methylthiotransferase
VRTRIAAVRRPPAKVHVITMGCAKNLVDSEKLMAQLRLSNVVLSPTLEGADVAVVNTCGFIASAREESIDMIIDTVKRKAGGSLRKVYAMGCLTERYREEIVAEIPELDGVFGSDELGGVVEALGGRLRTELLGERLLTTPSHTAYLKISEGCDRPCAFCAIPLMRGTHRSRVPASVLEEARGLAGAGVRELVVIAQDTTSYGLDLDGRRSLASLLLGLADIPGIEWVRLMYAYPAQFPLDVLDAIAAHPHICTYLDIPVQHGSDTVLKSMRRGITRRATMELLETARRRVPGVALRTTLIVGYPAETEREFDELLSFVREVRFDRLGVFTYSQEEGTAAHPLGDPVPAEEKEDRLRRVMEAQQEIAREKNRSLIGSTLRVLVERGEQGGWVGRSEHDAPEIDNEVVLQSVRPLAAGEFVHARVVDALEYDVVAEVIV